MRRNTAESSFDELSSLIDDIHDAGIDGANWLAVLRRINLLLNSQLSALWIQDASGEFLEVRSGQQDHVRDYVGYYRSLDRLYPVASGAPIGMVVTNSMVVPPSEFLRTAFYNDFAKRYDMYDCMIARVLDRQGVSGYVSLIRSAPEGVFERPDIRLLSLLLPHLRRAMRTRISLAPAGIGRESAVEALDRLDQGVLITDGQGRIIHANRAAEAILAKGEGIGIEPSGGRQLRAATPEQTRALRRLIEQAAAPRGEAPSGGGVLRLVLESGGAVLASVTRLGPEMAWNRAHRPAALVLLSPTDQDMSPQPEHLRALYGLTPAEIAVATRLMRGDGIEAAARALRIAPATLHTHLSRIFDKTDTSRQAELVRLLQQVARLRTR